jgi:monoamine oxidase
MNNHHGTRRKFLGATAAGVVALQGCVTTQPATKRSRATDVIVIGAGLAGLNAAMLLEAAGLNVTVLEAANRIGGRVYTLDDVPGTPETGGTQIGYAYQRIIETASALKLALIPNGRSSLLSDERIVYAIGGQRFTRTEWIGSPLNPFMDAMRGTPPDRLLGRLIGANPLASVGAWREPANAIYDIPVRDHLRAKGVSEDALRLLSINNSYGDSLAATSLLNLYYTQANITEIMRTPGPTIGVAGGNQRLPEAMANSLREPVLTNQRVEAIEKNGDAHEVTTEAGRKYRARFVVCSLPLPAIRGVKFSPALPEAFQLAIQQVPYARVTQLHLAVKRPFWVDEGLSPYVWSDGLLERVFPSDPRATGMPQTLTCWINGAETSRWDALSDTDAEKLALTEMAKIFPSSVGAISLAKRISWHGNALAGGAWANWAPGQVGRFARIVTEPIGTLHFAGEHCGVGVRGLEGAMASGEQVARAILGSTLKSL